LNNSAPKANESFLNKMGRMKLFFPLLTLILEVVSISADSSMAADTVINLLLDLNTCYSLWPHKLPYGTSPKKLTTIQTSLNAIHGCF
jgi:hypothetical protein